MMKIKNRGSGFTGCVRKPYIFLGAAGGSPADESIAADVDGLDPVGSCSCEGWLYGCLILRAICIEGTGVKWYLLSIEFLLAFHTVLYRRCQYQEYKKEKQVIYFKMYIPYER